MAGRHPLHELVGRWSVRRHFPPEVLAEIERVVRETEARHAGEIRYVIEPHLDLPHLWHRLTPRERATQLFAQLGVWDTVANNGVLIYLLLADRRVEIVADRGISARVQPEEWASICRAMEAHFRAGRFLEGSAAGVQGVGALLERHFPGAGRGSGVNELPDRPTVL